MWNVQPAHSVGDLLRTRGPRPLVTVAADATAESAIGLLQSVGISQMPVIDDGKSVGSIQEVTLARVLHDHRDPSQVTVSEIMARPLPQVDPIVHLDEVYRMLLSGNTGVLVVSDGKVIDIVTRIDLIQYWNQERVKQEQHAHS
jgi:cystathionine beta-synthase